MQSNKTIEKMIRKRYYPQSQKLELEQLKQWANVLSYRNWDNLKALSIIRCDITAAQISAITNLEWENLQSLSLSFNQIVDIGANAILKRQWPKLTCLFLRDNKISSMGLMHIPSSEFLKKIKKLDLMNNPLGSKGAALLSKADMPVLETLMAGCCNLYNIGFEHLTKSKWPALKQTYFNYNFIGLDGLSKLTLFDLKYLEKIQISQWKSIWDGVYILTTNIQKKSLGISFSFHTYTFPEDVGLILRARLADQLKQ